MSANGDNIQAGKTPGGGAPAPRRRRFRYPTRRHVVITGVALALATVALLLLALFTVRLGYVDRFIANQIKDDFAKYGIRAEIAEFHLTLPPQTVEMRGIELYDAKSGERLGRIDRIL